MEIGFTCGALEFIFYKINELSFLKNYFPTSWIEDIIFDHIPITSIMFISILVMLVNFMTPFVHNKKIQEFIAGETEKLV